MNKKIIFLDRDGVINKEVGYLHKIKDFEFIDGVFDACLDFQLSNYKIIIITNQSGINRGYYSKNDFHTVNNWMLNQFKDKGINILNVFFCPHSPDENCNCRKPKPGMFLEACEKYDIDMKNSWMVGDKEVDIQAANLAGISNTILVKSGHNIDERNSKATFILNSIKQAIKVL